ncbi:unnamed protein product [Pseudo-nitzschia multistriata]|uniref:ABC transporter domain-containing protein n=1 Tax=Pseudo-nitzschia multistriata TaxID=183589 RepID=A0A448YXC4_9STRA|nr:unnamed protein product [Pseudo-nitzschia multistriata]
MPASEDVTQAQLSSLDDTDCYASVWEQILAEQRDEESSQSARSYNLWGGKGKGGRGLARKTIQPHNVVVEDVRLKYLLGDTCLEGATIKLLHNHVYCLVGRNGCGKSTLLKKMHSQTIPGWSVRWSSLYLPPTLPPGYLQLTPMQVVTKYLEECKKDSRLATESQISELEDRIDCLDLENEQEKMEILCEELSSLEDKLNFEDSLLKKQRKDLFEELGIDEIKLCEELQPVQQKEVLLCAACICCPFVNLLLMDEPTNDLDVHGLIRLRQLIVDNFAHSTTVLIVSHDIDLINDVATDIIDMCAQKLWYFPGNYDSYRLMKDQKESHFLKQSQAMERKNSELHSTLQHLKDKPVPKRRGGAKKKAKSVQSHRKKIEKHVKDMQILESSADIPMDRKGLSLTQRLKLNEITKTAPDKAVHFALPKVTSQWGEPLITAFDVGYGTKEDFSSTKPKESQLCNADVAIEKRDGFLFDCVDLCIEEGSQTCILGPGTSTSYLMKILAKKLAPTEGTVHHSSGLTIGYCDCRELKDKISSIGPAMTALKYLSTRYPKKNETDLRSHLAAFGLSQTSQAKTSLSCLSGGESFRFVLAEIMLENPPILFLEHPTSHLDAESVQAFAYSLREWNGTLIMLCQDASFLRSLERVKCLVIMPEEGKIRRIIDDDRGGMRGMDAYLKTLSRSIDKSRFYNQC